LTDFPSVGQDNDEDHQNHDRGRGHPHRDPVEKNEDFISLTDMLKAKDGDFFVSDWLRNRNTVEFLSIWESVYNPHFNYGECATIKSQVKL